MPGRGRSHHIHRRRLRQTRSQLHEHINVRFLAILTFSSIADSTAGSGFGATADAIDFVLPAAGAGVVCGLNTTAGLMGTTAGLGIRSEASSVTSALATSPPSSFCGGL